MTLGTIISFTSLQEEKYKIPEEDLLLEVSSEYLNTLDNKNFERRGGARLFVLEREIFYKSGNGKPVARIITYHSPEDANIFEGTEELKLDSSMNVEGTIIGLSKLLFLTLECYKLDEKIFDALKKENGRKIKS